MSDSLEKAAGEAVKITVSGQEFVISPLVIGDYLELRNYIKSQKINDFLKHADVIPAEVRAQTLVGLTSGTISEEETEAYLQNPEGMIFMLWRTFLKTKKDITLDETKTLLDSLTEQEIQDMAMVLTGVSADGDEKDPLPEGEMS